MNLYTLTSQQAQLAARLEEQGFDEQTIADTLESEGGAVEQAFEDMAAVRFAKEARKAAIVSEIERLSKLAETESLDVARIDIALKSGLERMGQTKLTTPLHNFSIAKNPASIQIIDGATVPEQFYVHKPAPALTISKSLISDAIKAGEDVSAFATQTSSTRLVIK